MAKKNKPKQRKRFEFLNVQLNEDDINPVTKNVHINLEFDMTKGTSKVINATTNEVFKNSGLTLGYEGANKRRITTEIKTNPDDHSFCFNLKLNRYKHIVAIDTNSFTYKSSIINEEVQMGVGIALALIEDDKGKRVEAINVPFVTSANCQKPENENWIQLIELLRASCKCSDPRKVGIVVDSDLGNIDAYNKQDKPIYGNYYLPNDYELIFASDKVNDNIFNRMISESHKLSKQLIPTFIKRILEVEAETKTQQFNG